jgi:benzodiazapine receptor
MTSDRTRQLATVAIFVVTVAMNAAANILPINGQQTGEISDRFQVFVIPAGYVFSIWGLIYLLLAAFTLDQARPSRTTDPTLRRLGWLPALTGVLNAGWILLFHYELFALTVPVMVALLLTLIRIAAILFADRRRLTGLMRWTVRLPFSVYLGWITVATIANVAQALDSLGVDTGATPPEPIASGVLLLGLAIALTFVWRFADIAYGAVIVWAYAGIAVKEAETVLVPWVAATGATAVALLVLVTLLRDRPPAARSMAGVGPSGADRGFSPG